MRSPAHEAESGELLRVHTSSYLESLSSAEVVARALEVPALRLISSALREQRVLGPMRLAVQGTIDAMDLALQSGFVFQLGGGFHHAFADRGEGFSLYADAAIAIRSIRARRLLKNSRKTVAESSAPPQGNGEFLDCVAARSRALCTLRETDTAIIIDLDAHRGNGCEHIFSSDPSVRFFDIYNFQIYPGPLDADESEAPYIIPIRAQTADQAYLATLADELPRFLSANSDAKLAIYNAGTDIVAGDPLGQLAVSEAGVLARDRFVLDLLADRNVPTVVLTSGGYTARSHILIAQSAGYLLERCGLPV
jgi:histone deacetylase 11